MKIPKIASYLHMPITQNVPIKILNEKSFWKKLFLWRRQTPKEKLIEDFYQILPKTCNKIFGYSDEIDVCCYIPKNFIFDGASIPKLLFFLYLPNGILYIGSFLHDYIYKFAELIIFTEDDKDFIHKKLNQKEADTIFYEVNQESNEFKVGIKIPYFMLRIFGFMAWNAHRKEDKK